MINLKTEPIINKIIKEVTIKIEHFLKNKITPTLAIIEIGDTKENTSYKKSIEKIFTKHKIKVKIFNFKETIKESNLIIKIKEINKNSQINGIIILRPLPIHLEEKNLRNLISKEKDVDGISDNNIASLFNEGTILNIPCTPKAVMMLLDHYNIDLNSKKVLIINRSNLIGKPLMHLLLQKDATVTIAHSKTKELEKETKNSDIIITATGKQNLITKKHIKKDHIIIDLGIKVINNKLNGDVNLKEVTGNIKMLSSIKEGIGKLTTYVLLLQLIDNIKID